MYQTPCFLLVILPTFLVTACAPSYPEPERAVFENWTANSETYGGVHGHMKSVTLSVDDGDWHVTVGDFCKHKTGEWSLWIGTGEQDSPFGGALPEDDPRASWGYQTVTVIVDGQSVSLEGTKPFSDRPGMVDPNDPYKVLPAMRIFRTWSYTADDVNKLGTEQDRRRMGALIERLLSGQTLTIQTGGQQRDFSLDGFVESYDYLDAICANSRKLAQDKNGD